MVLLTRFGLAQRLAQCLDRFGVTTSAERTKWPAAAP